MRQFLTSGDAVRTNVSPDGLACLEVQAHGVVERSRQEVVAARRSPMAFPAGWSALAPSMLRHADDQTVVSLAAVAAMLHPLGDAPPARFERWGILSASKFVGRSALATAINRFRAESAWGVSPHLIPHTTLHSPAGALSVCLKLRGPNLGIGGGPGFVHEGFLTALTWLSAGIAPGVILVLSEWSPELAPGLSDPSSLELQPRCAAVAVALTRSSIERRGYATIDLNSITSSSRDESHAVAWLGMRLNQLRTNRLDANEPPGSRSGHRRHGAERELPRPHFVQANVQKAHLPHTAEKPSS